MLGQALCKALAKHRVSVLLSQDLDVTSLSAARRVFSDLKADWIVHTAAFTNVEAAELNSLEPIVSMPWAHATLWLQHPRITAGCFTTVPTTFFDGTLKRPTGSGTPPLP